MNETRVNLKHLLEDIRDAYTSPLEEVILTELVANALDSKATDVNFVIDNLAGALTCVDNGTGMKRAVLKSYHNIAASTKSRGQGIGFAGVGAKLSLLIGEKVYTESRGGHGSQCATEWYLLNPYRAPWKFIPFSGKVSGSRGTAVTISFGDTQSHLLRPEFVKQSLLKHFYPLLSGVFYAKFLKYFYKQPVKFFINGEQLILPEEQQTEMQNWFDVRLGKTRQPAGIGFLVRTGESTGWLEKLLGKQAAVSSLPSGVWISTFGKVIKGGWEWLGILPKNSIQLSGLVEVPGLSEILTTSKNDFLSDQNSLKKYYKYRKAIQEAVLPILAQMGENPAVGEAQPEKLIKPLNESVTSALTMLVGDFPELEGLIGSKKSVVTGKPKQESIEREMSVNVSEQKAGYEEGVNTPTTNSSQDINKSAGERMPSGVADGNRKKTVRAKTSGLKLVLAEIADDPALPLGRVVDDILTINTAHPAWKKAKLRGQEEYHVLITVAATLAQFLESEHSPHEFLNRLLTAWATEKEKTGKLF